MTRGKYNTTGILDRMYFQAMDLLDHHGPDSPQLREFLGTHGKACPPLVAYVQRAIATRAAYKQQSRSG